jgi:hypothetical protein
MTSVDCAVARRSVIRGVGIGIGAGLVAPLVTATSSVAAEGGSAPAVLAEIHSSEYWAKKGDVSLYLYRKRVDQSTPSKPSLPVLFLVHGSSISARPTFDLVVPGRGEYSCYSRAASMTASPRSMISMTSTNVCPTATGS